MTKSEDVSSKSSDTFCLGERFEKQVRLHADAPALSLDGAALTYRALNARANQIAAYLRKLGIGREALVGIHLDRSFDLIVGIMAILKSGGAYLPLDMACPEDRLKFMLEDSGARVVLTDSRLASHFAHYKGPVVCLDQVDLTSYSSVDVESSVRPENLAYVIYTSGSTGTPKGVPVTHDNVARLFTATEAWFHFGPKDVWSLFHSCAFDFSVWEIFGALLYGGRLVVVPYAVSRSAEAFRELIRREKVTVLSQTPSAFRQLVRADQKVAKANLALRYIIFAGEALEFQSLVPWFERYGDEQPKCINMYGITETTVHVTYRRVTRKDVESGSGSNIGIPIPDLQVYVVNEQGAQVAPNEEGEIWVGGRGVARGYLNRPELTEQRFLPNPFDPELSPRVYRSGDRARLLANGDLEYLGRIDFQVKIRGFRIELNEIESVLAKYPGVRECTVLARAEADEEPRLVAYVASDSVNPLGIEAMRQHLSTKLPEYMVPAVYVFLDSFPLTINGKLDRAKLPAPSAERPRLAVGYEAPQDELEVNLVRIWRAALHLDKVGTNDNYFDLGGDSLSAMMMLAEAEKFTGRPIGLRPLLEGGTIKDIAAVARKKGPVEPPPIMICTQPGTANPPLFFAHGDLDHAGFYCHKMGVLLGPEQPVYALAPHGTFGGNLYDSFQEAAASYIELIRSVQPTGPYHLGGFCNGALAMYEVAQQLIREGESVESLVLLDPPDLYFTFLRTLTKVGKGVGLRERSVHGAYQRIVEGIEVWTHHRTLRSQGDFFNRVMGWMGKKLSSLFKGKQTERDSTVQALKFHYYHVMAGYEPEVYRGSKIVWIMLREGESTRVPQQISYWSRIIPGARFEVIPGTHLELRDSMGKIVDVIQTAMSKSSWGDGESATWPETGTSISG
jgi:amino acid adenylation domain-containing protein